MQYWIVDEVNYFFLQFDNFFYFCIVNFIDFNFNKFQLKVLVEEGLEMFILIQECVFLVIMFGKDVVGIV